MSENCSEFPDEGKKPLIFNVQFLKGFCNRFAESVVQIKKIEVGPLALKKKHRIYFVNPRFLKKFHIYENGNHVKHCFKKVTFFRHTV